MKSSAVEILPRQAAEQYADWFRALADPTRVQLLAWLAAQPEPVTVGELTAVLPVGQSTVSHHLAALGAVGFVTMQRRGTSSLYAVNPRCLERFPSAADVVMGRTSEPVAAEACPPVEKESISDE